MKVHEKDYPFTILVEDKISKSSGNLYQSISIGYTYVKNKEAQRTEDKYETTWFNFFDETNLLKLALLAESSYISLKNAKLKEWKKRSKQQPDTPSLSLESPRVEPNLDDDIPF